MWRAGKSMCLREGIRLSTMRQDEVNADRCLASKWPRCVWMSMEERSLNLGASHGL
jgi:hypothetical protein